MADAGSGAFHYTEEDLVEAARLFSGRSVKRPKIIVAYASLWLASLIFFLSWISGPGLFDPAAIRDNIGLLIAILILPFALVFVWAKWVIPTMARRNFRQQRAFQAEFTYGWNDERLTVSTEYGHFDIPWHHFVGWAENANIILLLETDRLYRVIPKRVLNPDQQHSLRHHLAGIGI